MYIKQEMCLTILFDIRGYFEISILEILRVDCIIMDFPICDCAGVIGLIANTLDSVPSGLTVHQYIDLILLAVEPI